MRRIQQTERHIRDIDQNPFSQSADHYPALPLTGVKIRRQQGAARQQRRDIFREQGNTGNTKEREQPRLFQIVPNVPQPFLPAFDILYVLTPFLFLPDKFDTPRPPSRVLCPPFPAAQSKAFSHRCCYTIAPPSRNLCQPLLAAH